MKKWHGVRGSISVEVVKNDDGEWFDVDDNLLPISITQELEPLFSGVKNEDIYAELVVDFTSSGYHQPMSMYGGSDHLGWPEEYEDERELDGCVGIWISDEKGKWVCKGHLSQKASDDLFQSYLSAIEACEVDWDEYDGPDHDDDY